MRNITPPAWAIHPFLRLAPSFLFGILAGLQGWAGLSWIWATVIASLVFLLGWTLLAPTYRWAGKPITGAALFLMLAAAGSTCSWMYQLRMNGKAASMASIGKGLIVQLHDVTPGDHGRYRARASPMSGVQGKNETMHTDLLLYIDSGQSIFTPRNGDLMAVRATWKPIRNRGNPGEPDHAGALAEKGSTHQAFARPKDLFLLERRDPGFWEGRFQSSREWIENVMQRYLHDSAAADLASTLITGHRSSMDPELLKAYADTGVVHVIAISGLHLGMIHGLILWLLSPLFRQLGWSRAGGLIVLPWLWVYACFTGASASVIRSAVMFTGIGIAKAQGRRQFLLNGLGSSAMVLLAVRPDWIADIGFQLSYAALLSIALFQTRMKALIQVRNPIAAGIRDLVSVTLAAQVLTAPLVAWHFHRLPLLFLFSNLLVVPLSSLVLLLCLLVCICSGLPALAAPLGHLSTLVIRIMNGHVLGMDAVPHASLTDLQPTVPQVVILYLIIALARSRPEDRSRKAVLATIGVLFVAYRFIGMMQDIAQDRQRAFVVFNVHRQSLYALVEGRDMLVMSDPSPEADSLSRNRCLAQAVAYYRCRTPVMTRLVPGKTVNWSASGRSWSIRCGQGWTGFTEKTTDASAIVLSEAFRGFPEHAPPAGSKTGLVADATLPLWKILQWKTSFERVPSRFHSVPEQGAFVTELAPSSQPAP